MNSEVKLAVVGCGRIAQRVHLRALSKIRGAKVVALADSDPRRLQEAKARTPDVRVYSDYSELLATSSAEAVIIALPPALHASAAVLAFGAGKHVYLEKPGATSETEARAVIHAWRCAGTVGMVGLNQRFHPMNIALRSAIRQGRVGDVVGARSVFCAAARELPPWKQSRSKGGGVFLDLAIHHVDLARFLFDGEIEEARAWVRSVRSENDTAALDLRLAGGAYVQIFVSMSAAEQDLFEVYGTHGRFAVDRYGSGQLRFFSPNRPTGRGEKLRAFLSQLFQQGRIALRSGSDPSHARALRMFVEGVRMGNPAAVPELDDAYRSVTAVLAAERAAASETRAPSPPAARSAYDDVEKIRT